MEIFFTILIMTLVVSLSGVVTRVMPFQIPLPLMQIAIGALLAWPTFGLHVEFDPELFLVLFIPPLLFADGWKTPTREFLEHGREIFGLALATDHGGFQARGQDLGIVNEVPAIITLQTQGTLVGFPLRCLRPDDFAVIDDQVDFAT